MKFIKENTKPALSIPAAILKISGLANKKAELHISKQSVVILKSRMTAMELIRTIENLNTLSSELISHLKKVCGSCQDCEDCAVEGFDDESDALHIPEYLLDIADIPHDAKLEAYANEDERTITIVKADSRYDLSDVPKELLDMLIASGVCLAQLEEHLYQGDKIYGE